MTATATGCRVHRRSAIYLALLLAACGGSPAPVEDAADAGADGMPKPEENKHGGVIITGDPEPQPSAGGIGIEDQLALHWNSSLPKTSNGSTTVTGAMNFQAGPYTVPLAGATATYWKDSSGAVSLIYGSAQVTLPALHTFAGLGLGGSPLAANFGYDTGASLASLGLPLAPERKYLYLKFKAGYSSSFGTGEFSANTSQETAVVIDHKDPSFFFAGPLGPISAIALSEHSLIPFTPKTTWGFDTPESDFPTFRGQSYVAGEVSLEEFPITVSGDVTTRFVGWDGQGALDKKQFEHTVGVNGSFNLGWDFADGLFRLEVPLSKASLYLDASAHPYRSSASISGTAGTSTFLPSWIPATISANASLAGFMDTGDPSHNHLDAASEMTIHASTLGKAIGIPLNDLPLSAASLHVDRMGFRIKGEAGVGISPQIYSATAKITACFGGDPVGCLADDHGGTPLMGSKDWILRMEGNVTVVGVPMISSTTTVSPKGFTIDSVFRTGGQDIIMAGAVTAGGHIKVTGTAGVSIPLTDANQIVSAAAGIAVCGYQKITSAAICGADVLTKTDEFHCGKPHCKWSWKHGLRCQPISCSISLPRACNDVTKPIPCPPKPINLGTVSGSVAVTIDDRGIGGKFSGKFCTSGSSCSTLASGGTLDFSSISHPRMCIDTAELPGQLPPGKFCVAF